MRGLIAAAVLFAATPALAAGVEVSQPWSRPAMAGMTGVGFMTLTNRGKAPDALVGVETPIAASAEVHRTSMAGGVMSMARQASVPVPPGRSVSFAPGGYHLMFLGLKAALKAGDKAPATLVFASGARVKTSFVVGSGLSAPMTMDHH